MKTNITETSIAAHNLQCAELISLRLLPKVSPCLMNIVWPPQQRQHQSQSPALKTASALQSTSNPAFLKLVYRKINYKTPWEDITTSLT